MHSINLLLITLGGAREGPLQTLQESGPEGGPRCGYYRRVFPPVFRGRLAHSSSNTEGIKSSNPLEMSATFEEMSVDRAQMRIRQRVHARTQMVAPTAGAVERCRAVAGWRPAYMLGFSPHRSVSVELILSIVAFCVLSGSPC